MKPSCHSTKKRITYTSSSYRNEEFLGCLPLRKVSFYRVRSMHNQPSHLMKYAMFCDQASKKIVLTGNTEPLNRSVETFNAVYLVSHKTTPLFMTYRLVIWTRFLLFRHLRVRLPNPSDFLSLRWKIRTQRSRRIILDAFWSIGVLFTLHWTKYNKVYT